jgi:hypothetical protein
MNWFIFVYEFYLKYYKDSIYVVLKQKEHMCKQIAKNKLTKKKLWTFEWLQMSHIFITPYHNHFGSISIFIFLTCTLKNLNGYSSYGFF